jgi:hypothetical protein
MKWFGPSWGAYVCESTPQATLPGVPCTWCGAPIVEGDQGLILPFAGQPEDPPEVAGHLDCVLSALGLAPSKKEETDG